MKTRRGSWVALMTVALFMLAGACGEDEITSPTTHSEPPEPPVASAPSAPSGISVTLQLNSAWVRWIPGDGASTQEVLLTSADGLEPDRIKELTYVATGTNHISFADLTWGGSYNVVVASVNKAGRAESDPASFEVTIPEAPVLTWFSSTRDPTCLTVEWSPAGATAVHRVVLTEATDGTSFDATVRATETEAVFCASPRPNLGVTTSYPIVDGMTYTARVVAEFDGLEVASNTREFTVDFDPEYSLTGVWIGGAWFFGEQYSGLTLDLVDTDGDISGWWKSPRSSGRVSGTRIGGDFEFTIDNESDYDNHWSGNLEGPDRIRAIVWPGLVYPVQLERE